jgi:hypothetical protein
LEDEVEDVEARFLDEVPFLLESIPVKTAADADEWSPFGGNPSGLSEST